jgi:hypothetical protein
MAQFSRNRFSSVGGLMAVGGEITAKTRRREDEAFGGVEGAVGLPHADAW